MNAVAVVSLRQANGYDVDAASNEAATKVEGKSLTVQSQTKDSDINEIVRRFGLTGELPVAQRVPLDLTDVDDIVDYKSCLNAVLAARQSYESMPVELRNRVNNDPTQLVEFVLNPENRADCVKYGLIVEPVAPVEAPAPAPGAS